ncbi:MAG TPA: T9SS type A sorting domain-containing protein [Saprospiraceae bacterium]|nr:T9SS type A sorting domain-containing protein [Saprospiraceae bacterium]
MQKHLKLFALIALSIIILANSGNPPDGRTGAAGESTCMVGCHIQGSSGNLDGSVSIGGFPSTINPGANYTLTLTINNSSVPLSLAERGGFQLVILDANGANAGTLSAASSSSTLTSSGGRTYWEHNPAKNFSGGPAVSWTVNWKAPSSAGGNTITATTCAIIADIPSGNSNDLQVTDEVSGTFMSLPPLTVNVTSFQNLTCAGSADGSITVSASGGTGPYNYDWAHGASGATLTGLSAGTYQVTATDQVGATGMVIKTITEPAEINIKLVKLVHVNCLGDATGEITISASGGTGALSYSWSNGATGTTIKKLATGVYTVTVKDSKQCSQQAEFNVLSPDVRMDFVVDSLIPPTCPLQKAGRIQIHAITGNDPYKIRWSNGDSTFRIIDLAAGTYKFTITDATNCTLLNEIKIAAKDSLAPTLKLKSTNVYLSSTGKAKLNGADVILQASDQCDPVKLIFSLDSFKCSDLGNKKLIVIAQDSSGNSTKDSVEIRILDTLSPIIQCVADSITLNCHDLIPLPVITDNCVTDTFWTTPENKINVPIQLGRQEIQYFAKDASGNLSSCTSVLTLLESITVTLDSVKTRGCAENGWDAYLNFESIYDTSYFILLIGEDTTGITGDSKWTQILIKGDLNLQLQDPLGCYTNIDTILSPVSLMDTIAFKKEYPSDPNGSNGSLETNIYGGTPPYTLEWLDINQKLLGTGFRFSQIREGIYLLRVTDAIGCQKIYGPIELLTVASKDLVIEKIKFYPNPVNEILYVECSNPIENGFMILDQNGVQHKVGQLKKGINSLDISDLRTGIYFISILSQEKRYVQKIAIIH